MRNDYIISQAKSNPDIVIYLGLDPEIVKDDKLIEREIVRLNKLIKKIAEDNTYKSDYASTNSGWVAQLKAKVHHYKQIMNYTETKLTLN